MPGDRSRHDGPPRLVTLWLPEWSPHAAGIGPAVPAAVVHRHRIVAVTAAARAEGVRVGLRRREAQARCSQLVVVDHDHDRDARRFEPVVRAVSELVPLVELTEPGVLTFATRGPSRYLGGDDALVARLTRIVQESLDGSGTPIAIGVADGRFASGLAARVAASRGAAHLVPPGPAATRAFLHPRSVRSLHEVAGLPSELIERLVRLGISELGLLAGLPLDDVLARFGNDGVLAGTLARGEDPRLPGVGPPPADLAVLRTLDEPVESLDVLVFLVKQLADELHDALASRGLIATRVGIEAETEHGERSERVWCRPLGLGASAVVERARWQLEGWVGQRGAVTAGVVLLRLTPTEVRADGGRQLTLWGGRSEADEWAARAMARLAGVLGERSVGVPVRRGGRDPASAFALVPAVATDPDERGGAVADPVPAPPWPGRLPAPSPATVLVTPAPCEVRSPDGGAIGVSGRGELHGRPAVLRPGTGSGPGVGPGAGAGPGIEIRAWAGPWPVEERWWAPAEARRRARFQFVLADGRACLVVLERGSWWIEAWYE